MSFANPSLVHPRNLEPYHGRPWFLLAVLVIELHNLLAFWILLDPCPDPWLVFQPCWPRKGIQGQDGSSLSASVINMRTAHAQHGTHSIDRRAASALPLVGLEETCQHPAATLDIIGKGINRERTRCTSAKTMHPELVCTCFEDLPFKPSYTPTPTPTPLPEDAQLKRPVAALHCNLHCNRSGCILPSKFGLEALQVLERRRVSVTSWCPDTLRTLLLTILQPCTESRRTEKADITEWAAACHDRWTFHQVGRPDSISCLWTCRVTVRNTTC